jgi:hypothetical protein
MRLAQQPLLFLAAGRYTLRDAPHLRGWLASGRGRTSLPWAVSDAQHNIAFYVPARRGFDHISPEQSCLTWIGCTEPSAFGPRWYVHTDSCGKHRCDISGLGAMAGIVRHILYIYEAFGLSFRGRPPSFAHADSCFLVCFAALAVPPFLPSAARYSLIDCGFFFM